MAKPIKLLITGLFLIGFWWTGYWFGAQRLRVAIRDFKPVVAINKTPFGKQEPADFTLFWTVWDKVQTLYVDKEAIDTQKMVDGAISGMVSALGDPYTIYLPKQENKESKEDLGGAFGGVGIQLGYDKDNRLSVVAPLADTPAQKAGVLAGDLILQIKDQKKGIDRITDGITIPEAVKLIRGDLGTSVNLTMLRPGQEKPYTVDLQRETIVVKSVTVEYKDGVAWLQLIRFGDRTQEEWNAAVAEIKTHQPEVSGMVLDLRNNPGGYLEMAVYIASEFLTPGKIVVEQQYGDGTLISGKVERNGQLTKLPTVVLVNKGSASAAEILAGALQDHKRAQIVGEQTFGKGSVQQPEDFTDGSGIHVTVAKWLRPSGEWIDKQGIKPDVEAKMEVVEGEGVQPGSDKDTQLLKALELLKQ